MNYNNMMRLSNNQLAKEKRVRFSAISDSNVERVVPNASEPSKHQSHNQRNRHFGKRASVVNKEFVRNVEEGISAFQVHLDRRKKAEGKLLDRNCELTVQTQTSYRSKFEAPELYSSLCIAKAIQVIANTGTTTCTEYEDLDPKVRKAMKDKILLKLNIPPEEKLYKDLIPVKVDDAELVCKHATRKEMPTVYNKDIEPQLSDFCKPVGGREFCMWTKPVLYYGERLKYYNGFSLCKNVQIWQA